MRRGPMRSVAQRWSVSRCAGCIEAMIFMLANWAKSAIAAVAFAVGRDDGGESVEGDVIGAVADGVKGELEAVTVALDGEGFQLVGRYAHDAGGVRVVGIRGEHRGGASAERAVENFFQRAGFEPGVGAAAIPPHLLQAREIDFEGQPFGDADI